MKYLKLFEDNELQELRKKYDHLNWKTNDKIYCIDNSEDEELVVGQPQPQPHPNIKALPMCWFTKDKNHPILINQKAKQFDL